VAFATEALAGGVGDAGSPGHRRAKPRVPWRSRRRP